MSSSNNEGDNKMKKLVISSMVIVSAFALSSCTFINDKPSKVVTDEYDFGEDFKNVQIEVTCEDVHVMASEDDECHIVFSHSDKMKTTVNVKNDALVIKEKSPFLYNPLNNSEDTKLDIYLPEGEFERFDINTASGDINIGDMTPSAVDIDSASGNVVLTNVVSDSINVDTASGNITLEDCDADDIKVDSASGNIRGTLLSGKDFNVDTALGKVDVPDDSKGGKCDINTASGDVKFSVK